MQSLLRKIGVYTLCACFILTGCVTNGTGPGPSVGPQLSSLFDPKGKARVDPAKPRLDVVVPVFDPGLSDAGQSYEEEGVWPELRRAEANRFALKLKEALEKTGAFGAVRVTPDASATGDLYVEGEILESNGGDVEIRIEVTDISGTRWFVRDFDHSVSSGFHKNTRNEGVDPYDPVFEEAANRVALELDDYSIAELNNLSRLTELRFGSNFTEEAFAEHLKAGRNTVSLLSFPSDSDPMLERTRAVRVRDQLFVDGLQEHYRAFSVEMQDSYLIWQEQSLLEVEARREANEEAVGEAVLGALTIGLGVLAIIAGANSGSYAGQTAGLTGGVVAGTVGATLLSNSFQTSKEAEVHREALEELGQSIDIDLAPRVVAFEEKTVELTGTAKEQFAQWRAFLQRVFEEERTPNVKL
ncbi:MAG: hypothetical protein CL573_08585 [Alphaproteobacteria bacterium]|nr:hypothetical protein [Alphaproteobacteria bacterium]HCP00343.1 hypothetical protein [Rhodospirillaceae bacterium]